MKKGVLKISQNSQEYACVRVFCNSIEKETLAQVFSSELCKILRTPFLQNTSGWLLLPICYANKIERAKVFDAMKVDRWSLKYYFCFSSHEIIMRLDTSSKLILKFYAKTLSVQKQSPGGVL